MDKVKVALALAASFLCSLVGALAVPLIVLGLACIIDYVTGINAAKYRGEVVDSSKGAAGINKKLGMLFTVVACALIDILIQYSIVTMGFDFKLKLFVSSLVAVWLACNELLSILENISDTGVNIPKFILKLLGDLKTQVDKGEE